MTNEKLKLLVIVGSVRAGRFGPVAAQWIADRVSDREEFALDVIDLADVALPLELPAEPPAMATTDTRPDSMRPFSRRLDEADAIVIVTPEYNHSFPASIKAFIDWHFTHWQAKPIGFVSYGGQGGGLRAVEQLRLVLGELHAVTVRDSVSFSNYWEQFGEDGQPASAGGPTYAAGEMLDQILWWGRALRVARDQDGYLLAS